MKIRVPKFRKPGVFNFFIRNAFFGSEMRDPHNFYKENLKALDVKLDELNGKSVRVSNLRLMLALLSVGSVYASFALTPWFLLTLLLCAVTFTFLVRKSAKLDHETSILRQVRHLNHSELEFLHGNKSVFDKGDDHVEDHHLYAVDLDIFGTGSLFQAIDRTGTKEGRKLLIQDLLHPPQQIETTMERTVAISELLPKAEWRQRFSCIGKLSGETKDDVAQLNSWANQPGFYKERKGLLLVAAAMTAVSGAFILWMLVAQQFYAGWLLGLLFLNSFILTFSTKARSKYFSQFGQRTLLFEKFSELFQMTAEEEFSSASCQGIGKLSGDASLAFREISRLSGQADQRLNGLTGPLMNGLFYFDVWSIRRIERWREKNGHQLTTWIAALAQMDRLASMANFAFNHPSFAKAEIIQTNKPTTQILAREMGHPLMAVSVKNDYAIGIDSRAHIITGSNMAGKSTFIRAVGLNVILALNGLPVCAESFSCSVLRVATCIRITDSLEEDASYFKAELTRLTQIIKLLEQGEPCLVLLDEIMRGTNSTDKRNGTIAFYKKLRHYNCLALLATHDLEIGRLEQESGEHFRNYCFESTIKGNELSFDYRLKPGISTSTNASYLMKHLGLTE